MYVCMYCSVVNSDKPPCFGLFALFVLCMCDKALNVGFHGKQSHCFPQLHCGKHWDSRKKKNWQENKIYCLPGEYWFSLHNPRDNTETLGKTNWQENKICCLPREYWLSVHNLRDNALCTTVRKPFWLIRFISTSVRVKGLRDRMTFKYFLHFFSRLRSASRFSMFWVTFTALFFFDPSCCSEWKQFAKQ